MKKIMTVAAVLLAASLAFVSCGGGNSDPTEPTTEETVVSIVAADNNSASETVSNEDGSLTGIATAKYSGTALVAFINADKTTVASGKTVTVAFDYAVGDTWSDSTLSPKFAIQAGLSSAKYYSLAGSGTSYKDGDVSGSGSFEVPVTLTADSDVIKVQFNAYNWTGDTDKDTVKITIKSIKVE